MAGRLSFSIAINLLTENFKRGTNQVKAAFRSMQMQILTFAAALGAGGLGLSNLVSRFIDVARETNRVTTALKNVSGTMSQYADNQKYLLDLAKKYGLEINALTANYAKFTASASISGMSMIDQRKVFESVSRACTAFGMSADDSNGVMLALSQMMSKGKISSEELRLQMGERLPVALQAMAKAAGVSVAGLDKLLKQGKLMSKDVLPKFAEALNEMIPNVDTDNLETSVNRLKNTFTELVNSMNIQGKYKSLVDGFANVLRTIQNSVTGLAAFIITILTGKLLKSVAAYFSQFWKFIDTTTNKAKVAEAQKLLFTQKRLEAEKVYEETKTAYETTENGKRLASAAQLRKAKGTLDKAQVAEKKAIEAEKTAIENASAVRSTTIWGKTAKTIKLGFAKVAISLKTLWASAWPMLLITAIGAVIGKLVDMYKEAKRVRDIFSDYKKELSSQGSTMEIARLKVLQKLYNDATGNQKLQEQYHKRIEGVLGEQIKKNKSINDIIGERIKLLEATATADFLAQKKVKVEDEQHQLGLKSKQETGLGEKTISDLAKYRKLDKKGYNKQLDTLHNNGYDILKIDSIVREYAQNAKVLGDVNKRLEDAEGYIVKSQNTDNNNFTGDDDTKQTSLQKEEENYRISLQTYKNQLDAGAITQEKYNEEIDKLNKDTVIKLGGILGKSADANETYAAALLGALNPRVTESAKAQEELLKVQKEYKKATDLTKSKLDKKLISEDEYRRSLIEAAVAAANSAISIENIGDAADSFIKKMQGVVGDNLKIETPKLGKRDTTFDYKKTDVDKKSEGLDIWVKYKDDLKEKLEEAKNTGSDTAKSLEIEFNNAIANVDDMEKALKLAQVQEDIKNFGRELDESLYSGVKDIASGSDRIVNAFSNLRDVMNDVDATEWERIMAIWNTLTNVIDSFMSICKMIENITELTNKLTKAKEIEGVIEKQASDKKIIGAVKEMAVDTASAETKKANSRGVVAANTAEAATAAGKSVAGIPIVGIALAAAAVAGIVALFATLPKFARGGIIGGGPTSGDKMLARVNAGEMILNQGQQSHLFEAINSGRLGGGGNISSSVTTRVRAKDLILTINNELKSQGKKPIS